METAPQTKPCRNRDARRRETLEIARTYNAGLMERGVRKKGTPMKPEDRIEVFVFALFNENKKEGETSERNFGISNGDGSKVYDLDTRCQLCSDGWGGGGGQKGGMVVGPSVWCVLKPHAEEKVVEEVLEFCCGAGGVDCREVYEKGSCFEPNKPHAHASTP